MILRQLNRQRPHSSLLAGILLFVVGLGTISHAQERSRTSAAIRQLEERISPVLLEHVQAVLFRPQYDYPFPVIVQVAEDEFDARATDWGGEEDANPLPVVNGYATQLTARQIAELLKSTRVEYVTVDMPVRPAGKGGNGKGSPSDTAGPTADPSALKAIGADRAHAASYKGGGVTVALFDSGMQNHPDLKTKGAVRAGVDFSSGIAKVHLNANGDDYGHGAHVSGIIAGNGRKSGGLYSGAAPKAKFLDVKVIGADGTGKTSNLIKAIDWVIANKRRYEISLANLSLGHPPVESYKKDPLCAAVARMIDAGITTVISAGNLGKTAKLGKIWGAINSPANLPQAITVGAINTKETPRHSDDKATSYSSRGPTYIDGLFKPDLSAPGNNIASLLISKSYLEEHYPEKKLNEQYLVLSGSSMAAGYVTGTVALMQSANHELTPSLTKAILLLSAIKLRWPHLLEQGNGLVNAWTAVKLAEAMDVTHRELTKPVSPYWYLEGEKVYAGGAVAVGNRLAYSRMIDGTSQPIWGGGKDWSDAIIEADSTLWTVGFFESGSVIWGDRIRDASTLWAENSFWDSSVSSVDSVLWSASTLWAGSVLWSDSTLWSDTLIPFHYTADR